MKRKLTAEDLKLLDQYRKHQAYMAAYNKRGYVRAKRRLYNKDRWAAIKAARAIAGENEVDETSDSNS
jgi:hypothetical protein